MWYHAFGSSLRSVSFPKSVQLSGYHSSAYRATFLFKRTFHCPVEKHTGHIPCYALRAELGLRNSSKRVEKENDLVVAQRQKHNGMSWSATGSGALAQITTLSINGELYDWLRNNDVSSISTCSA